MELMTFRLNVSLGGCVAQRAGVADNETYAFITGLMDECGAMLAGRARAPQFSLLPQRLDSARTA